MWRITSALRITWINIMSMLNIIVSLWNSTNSLRNIIEIRQKFSTKWLKDWVIQEFKWNEKFLPHESVNDFDDHTNKSK